MIILEKIIKFVICVLCFCFGFYCILYYKDRKIKFFFVYFIGACGVVCFTLSIVMAIAWVFI